MIYDFYVDKVKKNKDNKYLEIKPDYPIELKDNQYATVKLCDFKYLNNLYNISNTLQNNTLVLKRTEYSYGVTEGTTTAYLDLSGELYKASPNENTYLDDVSTSYADGIRVSARDTDPNYKVYYKGLEATIITNIFDSIVDANDATKSLDFTEDDNEIIIETTDNTSCPIVKQITFDIHKHNSNAVISGMTFELQVYGSNDNTNYTRLSATTPSNSYIDFTLGSTTVEIKTNTFDITNSNPYKYYKFKLNNIYYNVGDSDYSNYQGVMSDFKLAKLLVKEIEYTTSTTPTIGATTNINLTLTDGFYNSTTFINKLNELFTSYNIVVSLDTYTNKLIFTNTPTYSINPIYSDPNGKLELQFLNENIKNNYGSDTDIVELPSGATTITNSINLTNFAKLVIACDLNFQVKTHNDITSGNNEATGIGNVLAWIDNDNLPMSYINYVNYEMRETRISNKHINNIRLIFYNEKSQVLYLDNALVHLQIKIYEE